MRYHFSQIVLIVKTAFYEMNFPVHNFSDLSIVRWKVRADSLMKEAVQTD